MNRNILVNAYIALAAATAAAFVMFEAIDLRAFQLALQSPVYLALSAAVIFSALSPVGHARGGNSYVVSAGAPCNLTILALFGIAPALVSLALACVIDDIWVRAPKSKMVFNVATQVLCYAPAALLLESVATGTSTMSGELLLALALGVVTSEVIGVLLVNGVISLSTGSKFVRSLTQLNFDLLASNFLVAACAPLLMVIASDYPALLPFAALPMIASYRSSQVTARREHDALHDALTGLPNRSFFYGQLEDVLSDGKPTAILLMDLNRFKEINDTLGHGTGDMLLKDVAARLRTPRPEETVIARMGGDEFGVVLLDEDADAAIRTATAIAEVLHMPYYSGELRLDSEVSIGIAISETGDNAETLVQKADVAMYVAKENQAGPTLYLPEHNQYSPERLALVGDLRSAIDDGQLIVHYQPKIDIASSTITGAEALVRWIHPVQGFIGPDVFIPLAEKAGLMGPLTRFVLEAALIQCREWAIAYPGFTMAVNVSARSLHDHEIIGDIARLLHLTGVDPRSLRIEVTESSVMTDGDRCIALLEEVAAMGVGISIDDFGTGYSSLAYLKKLPVNELKIDRSFVMDLGSEEDDSVIVRSTVDLGHNLGLRVVAEGVETERGLEILKSMGCDVAQGYYFAKPMAGREASRWFADFSTPKSASVHRLHA